MYSTLANKSIIKLYFQIASVMLNNVTGMFVVTDFQMQIEKMNYLMSHINIRWKVQRRLDEFNDVLQIGNGIPREMPNGVWKLEICQMGML